MPASRKVTRLNKRYPKFRLDDSVAEGGTRPLREPAEIDEVLPYRTYSHRCYSRFA